MTLTRKYWLISLFFLVASRHYATAFAPQLAFSAHHAVTHQTREATVDGNYYSTIDLPTPQDSMARVTLSRYLAQTVKEKPELRQLEGFYLALSMACKTISNLVNRAGLNQDTPQKDISDGRYYSMKRLDQLSTTVLRNALRTTGKCDVVKPRSIIDEESPSKHQPGVLLAQSLDSNFVAILDPLDGSGNADASICTGTVFGVFESESLDSGGGKASENYLVRSVLQPARNMRAAGYCLYSSSTVLVFTLGDSVQGFTLDPQLQEFVLTHPNLTIPQRGNVYSCNEANSEGWDESFKSYLRKLKLGKGETGQRYAHRYVGSMVGDVHRTLLYGGIFCYPRDNLVHLDGNLQLSYKSAPMAFVVNASGGRAITGSKRNLLDEQPERVHQKKPVFLGSSDDVDELEKHLSQ